MLLSELTEDRRLNLMEWIRSYGYSVRAVGDDMGTWALSRLAEVHADGDPEIVTTLEEVRSWMGFG